MYNFHFRFDTGSAEPLYTGPGSGNKFFVSFVPLAIGLVCLGFFVYTTSRSVRLVNSGIKVEGRVIDVRTEIDDDHDGRSRLRYISVIEYYARSGVRHETTQSNTRSKHSIGSRVELIYDPGDPYNVSGTSLLEIWLLPGIALVNGVAFGALGGFLMYRYHRRKNEIEWLMNYGAVVRAKVVGIKEVVRNTSRRAGRSYSYKLICEYDAGDNRPLRFVSDSLPDDPGEAIVGKEVEVLFDSSNPTVYYVKTESLYG